MDLKIKGKKALITGAGRGLGKAIAAALAKEGVKIVLISRTKTNLEKVYRDLGGKKAGHYLVALDLTKKSAPEKAYRDINKHFGSPDILVNNLGDTLDIRDPYCSMPEWQKILRINLEVAIEMNNLVIPAMRQKRWGRIVHISSISALENQGPVPYCTAKAALNAYSRSMGRVVAADGIIMTAVLPGAVYTDQGYWDITAKKNPGHVKKYLAERMAIKRFGQPEEIAGMVVFLCSELASFCVGSTIPIDGGQGRCFF